METDEQVIQRTVADLISDCAYHSMRHVYAYSRSGTERIRRCKVCRRLEYCVTPYGSPTRWRKWPSDMKEPLSNDQGA